MLFEAFDWDYNDYLGPNEFLELCVGLETGAIEIPPTPEESCAEVFDEYTTADADYMSFHIFSDEVVPYFCPECTTEQT